MKTIGELVLRMLPLLIVGWGVYNSMLTVEDIENEETTLKQELEQVQMNIRKQKKRNKQAFEFKKNLEESKARVNEIKDQIILLQKQLPNLISDTENLELFSKEAEVVNIKNLYLSPLEEYSKEYYFAKQYELKGTATFLQCLIFFERLGSHERLLNISSLELTQATEKSKGRFQLLEMTAVVEAFRYNADDTESKEEEEGEGEDDFKDGTGV